jgi:undecaprenyl-diphosphatase
MDFLQITTLAILQGLTEFLPVSSSAHLILLPKFTNWQDQGLAYDIAVHVGSLLAVLMYFRNDLKSLISNWLYSPLDKNNVESKLVWMVVIGTIPVGLAGLFLGDYVDNYLRSSLVIAITTIVFGLLLGFADKIGKKTYSEYYLEWKFALFIGVAQAIALIPGTSRSGITITAALLIGLKLKSAARFSFLLSIPVIVLAGGSKTVDLISQKIMVEWTGLLLSVLLSAISAYFCIRIFMNLLERIGMLPFVIYRLLLGILLILSF